MIIVVSGLYLKLVVFLLAIAGYGWAAAEESAHPPFELPYRLLEGPSGSQVLLIGSSHGHLEGVFAIANSSKSLIASASLVAFERLPGAPSGTVSHPVLQSYAPPDTYRRIEQLVQSDKTLAQNWALVSKLPLPPELIDGFLAARCVLEDTQRMQKIRGMDRAKRLSLDRIIADALKDSVEFTELETLSEFYALRNQRNLLHSTGIIEGTIKFILSEKGCDHFISHGHLADELVKSRRLEELWEEFRRFDCMVYACNGMTEGVGFSKERNDFWIGRIMTILAGHRRIAVIVGALHLANGAGLLAEFRERGFHQIDTNLLNTRMQ